jgi:hypothetical protein
MPAQTGLAEIADSTKNVISKHPYLVAGGVGVVVLLFAVSGKKQAIPAGGMSENLKAKMIDADIQSQQIAASANVTNRQTAAGLAAAKAQQSAGVRLAGIQSATDIFGLKQGTIQARDSNRTQLNLANVQSALENSIADKQFSFQRWSQQSGQDFSKWSQTADQDFARWAQTSQQDFEQSQANMLFDYQKSADAWNYKIAKASAPYLGAQNAWLVRHGSYMQNQNSGSGFSQGFAQTFGQGTGQAASSGMNSIISAISAAIAAIF